MRIVVDAMGTDKHPTPDIEGTLRAAKLYPDDTLILVGPQDIIGQAMHDNRFDTPTNVEIMHATDIITMQDKPGVVGKQKPNSSMHVGMNLVKQGEADAFVTAGNTGAAHAIAMLFTLKRIPNVKRPALSAIFPIFGKPTVFTDVGANTDSRPEWLIQFGIMGSIYAERALHIQEPRIGLLSNGEEDTKGTQSIQDAAKMFRDLPINFVGNVEPQHVLSGAVDVLVCDGFSGNIMIKTFEAATRYLASIIREEISGSIRTNIGGLLARPAFNQARQRIDTFEVGGAPLLGVNGVVIISHGSSDARAIQNAIGQARQAAMGNVIHIIAEDIARMSTD